MWFWVFMLIMDLLVPITMICFGIYFEKNVPKEISNTFGYRTAMSMVNQYTWKFAHKFIGKLWKVCGWLILPVSFAVMLFAFGKDTETVGAIGGAVCAIQVVIMIFTVIPVEIALKKNFDRNGNRR